MNTKEYPDISIQIERINQIIGPNNAGKSLLCNTLYNGFQGKLKKQFIFNGNAVETKDYFVYFIKDTDTIDLEKKLGTKSQVKNRIESTIKSLDDSFIEIVENKVSELSQEIEKNILHEVELFNGLSLKFNIDLKDILMKNISIEVKNSVIDEIAYSEKRKAYIELFLDTINRTQQPSILIIDGIDNGLNQYSIKELLSHIEKKALENTVVFFSTSTYIENYNDIYIYQHQIENQLLNNQQILLWFADEKQASVEDIETLYSAEEVLSHLKDLGIENEVQEYFLSHFKITTKYKKLLNFKS